MLQRFINRQSLFLLGLSVAALLALNACGGAKPAAPTEAPATAQPSSGAAATEVPSSAPNPTTTPKPTTTTRPTTTPKPTITPRSTTAASSNSGDVVDQGVMAAGVTDLGLAPLGIAETFSPDQGTYHAVIHIQDAPNGSKFKAVWTAVDTGGAMPPNNSLGEYELSADGTRFLDFTYKPNNGHMPVGSYQVQIYDNGNLARTLSFTIDASAQVITPQAQTASACPPLALPTDTPPGFAIGVTMAPKTQGGNFEPVNPGRVFGPHDVFHAVVNIENAPDNTRFKAIWYAEDIGSAAPCNYKLNEGQLSSGGSRNLDFYISPGSEWPLGQYRVEIYVNDVKTITTGFSVTSNPSTGATSAPAEATATPASSSSASTTYPVQVDYQHTARDCFSNDTAAPIKCDPPGLDILSAKLTRPNANGPLTITVELAAGQSVKSALLWGMTYAFDLDRSATTGLQDVYPSQHGIGPDLYLLYGQVNGELKQLVRKYSPQGDPTDLDSSLAEWTWVDDTHLQVVVDPSLVPVERFNVVGDLTVQSMFDHFVEDGYLTFPEGQATHK